MIVIHKKAAQIIQQWNLDGETITDICQESTGNANDTPADPSI